MPTHQIHRKLSKMLLGKDYQEVNQIMDSASKYVPNPGHRDYFHDMPSLMVLFDKNPEHLRAAILHLMLDNAASNDSEFHRFLKIWVNLKE